MEVKYDLGIIVARMQTPWLHYGHLALIGTTLQQCDKVVIMLGTQQYKDDKNPYTFRERCEMISKVFPQVKFLELPDCITDTEWSRNLENKIDLLVRGYSLPLVALFHSRDSFKDSYKGKYPLVELEEVKGYSGTKLRESLNK